MKNYKGIIVLSFLLFSIVGCSQEMTTPKSTFKILLEAIEEKDLEAYKACWSEDRLEKEGMYSKLKNDDSLWEELQYVFSGPQKMKGGKCYGDKYRVTIKSPKVGKDGIGNMTMIKIDGKWKMHSW